MKIGSNSYTASDGSVHLSQGLAHLHDMRRAQQRAHAYDMQRAHAGFLRRSNDLGQPPRPNLRSGFRPISTIGRLFRFVLKACIIITILWIFIAGNGLAIVARIVDSLTSVAMRNSQQFVPVPVPSQPGSVIIPDRFPSGFGSATRGTPPEVIRQHPMTRFNR
jgi:hypothetical protein